MGQACGKIYQGWRNGFKGASEPSIFGKLHHLCQFLGKLRNLQQLPLFNSVLPCLFSTLAPTLWLVSHPFPEISIKDPLLLENTWLQLLFHRCMALASFKNASSEMKWERKESRFWINVPWIEDEFLVRLFYPSLLEIWTTCAAVALWPV